MIGNQIKELRKALDCTQAELGSRLGISRSAVANLEYDRVEPTDATIRLICMTFGLNESWLRTGAGEMYSERGDLAALVAKYQPSDALVRVLMLFDALTAEQKETVLDFAENMIAVLREESSSAPAALDIDREVDEYRAELEAQKNPAEKSSVSDIGVG